MNFGLSTEQRDLQALVAQVLAPLAAKAEWGVSAAADALRSSVWQQLASLDILCAGIPEKWGGVGGDAVETSLVAEEIGRSGVAVPYVSAIPTVASAIARFGTDAQCGALLPAILAGDVLPTLAVPRADGENIASLARRPAGYVLTGSVRHVPAAETASRLMIVARTEQDDAEVLVLVEPTRDGLTRELVGVTDHTNEGRFSFAGLTVTDDAVIRGEEDMAEWIRHRAIAGACGVQLGLCSAALRMAAAHCGERRQFGRALSEFQAVTQRLADAFIALQVMQVATRRLVAVLERGADARAAALVAKCLTAEGSAKIMRSAIHVHGGVGVDVSYPLARYAVISKRYELWLGGAGESLEQLGALLAAQPDLDAVMAS